MSNKGAELETELAMSLSKLQTKYMIEFILALDNLMAILTPEQITMLTELEDDRSSFKGCKNVLAKIVKGPIS